MAKARLQSADGNDAVSLLRREIQETLAKQAKKDAGVIEAMDRGAGLSLKELAELEALDPKELHARGWTKRDVRIAKRGLRSKSKAPFALVSAHERNLARIRRTEDSPAGAKLGIAIVNLPPRAERADDSRVVVIEAQEVRG